MTPFLTDWSSFRYCPKCGSGDMQFHAKHFVCCACGFVYYVNPSLAVGGLIEDEAGRLLVVTRGREPAQGTWDLPGGFVDPGESAEESLTREIREELGVTVTEACYFATAPNRYPYHGVTYHTTDLVFRCRVDRPGDIRPADDVAEARFLPREEIDPQRFGMASIRGIVTRYLAGTGT